VAAGEAAQRTNGCQETFGLLPQPFSTARSAVTGGDRFSHDHHLVRRFRIVNGKIVKHWDSAMDAVGALLRAFGHRTRVSPRNYF